MIETQWQVTWFPDDRDHVTRQARSKKHAMEIAVKYAEWSPLVETRTLVTGGWQIEWNSIAQ